MAFFLYALRSRLTTINNEVRLKADTTEHFCVLCGSALIVVAQSRRDVQEKSHEDSCPSWLRFRAFVMKDVRTSYGSAKTTT